MNFFFTFIVLIKFFRFCSILFFFFSFIFLFESLFFARSSHSCFRIFRMLILERNLSESVFHISTWKKVGWDEKENWFTLQEGSSRESFVSRMNREEEVVQIPEVRNLFKSVHAEATFFLPFVEYRDVNLSFNWFRKIIP